MRTVPGGRPRTLAREIQVVAAPGDAATPLYVRLYRQLREHILAGTLARGTALPSARTLAADLGVSRNTIEAAYGQLVAEGFVARRVGAGSVVAESVADAAPFAPARAARRQRARAPRTEPTARPERAARLSQRGAEMRRLGVRDAEGDRRLGVCATNIHRFPLRAWRRLVAREARRMTTGLLLPGPQDGLPALRQQIAEHATLARGLRCTPEQVFVVGSTQQALDLLARVLLDPGDVAIVEEPGYAAARAALIAAGARLLPAPVDDEGLAVDALPRATGARLVYVTPSHQFPLGVTMSLARRLALLRWADTHDTWIVEDDYDSEFRHDGRPLAALQALDRTARVLYVGTFNKVLFPGLRLAYLVLPAALVDVFAAARRIVDAFTPVFMQSVLAEFMAGGHYAAYLRQARSYYAQCRDLLVARAAVHWSGAVRLGPASTGLNVVAHLPKGTQDEPLADAAQRFALGVTALSRYYYGARPSPGLLFSYGAVPPRAIERAVRDIAPLLGTLRR